MPRDGAIRSGPQLWWVNLIMRFSVPHSLERQKQLGLKPGKCLTGLFDPEC